MSRDRRSHYQSRHGRISGFVVVGILAQTRSACTGVHLRSVPRSTSGFHSTRPRGKDKYDRCVELNHLVQVPPTGSVGDLHPQSLTHAQHTNAASASGGLCSAWADLFSPLRGEYQRQLRPVLTNSM